MYMAVASEPIARLTSILPRFSVLKTLIFAMEPDYLKREPSDGRDWAGGHPVACASVLSLGRGTAEAPASRVGASARRPESPQETEMLGRGHATSQRKSVGGLPRPSRSLSRI